MAARKTGLRVAAPDEKPAKPKTTKPKTVTEAASKGTTRELLVAMRDRIAVGVENPNTPAKDLAALSNRLMQIVREIEAIDAREDDEEASGAAEVQDGDFNASAV